MKMPKSISNLWQQKKQAIWRWHIPLLKCLQRIIKQCLCINNARNILIDLAKEYSSNEKLAEVTDKQYGAGCAEYIAKAIKLYYGL